jgi:hypothetical protein
MVICGNVIGNLIRIKDTVSDTYVWDGANGQFTFATFTSGNRGFVLGNAHGSYLLICVGPIQHVIAMINFQFTFEFMDLTGFSNVIITHATGSETHAISGNKMTFTISSNALPEFFFCNSL